jgi:hypothetical protein
VPLLKLQQLPIRLDCFAIIARGPNPLLGQVARSQIKNAKRLLDSAGSPVLVRASEMEKSQLCGVATAMAKQLILWEAQASSKMMSTIGKLREK